MNIFNDEFKNIIKRKSLLFKVLTIKVFIYMIQFVYIKRG